MNLRKYKAEDCVTLAQLFFDTVHAVNARDYDKPQLDAWATGRVDISAWDKSFLEHNTIICEIDGIIAGFGDMDSGGYLDRLYIHKDYQRRGVATAILTELHQQAALNGVTLFTTHSSITARPFFEKHGYLVIKENIVVRGNIELTNFIMQKQEKDIRNG